MSNEIGELSSTSHHDLDVFLAGVESKLRAPFSSLSLTSAIATAPSPRKYLETIGKVLCRMDKVVQLRVLVALLGLEPSLETDSVVYDILTQAQDEALFEEWVRVAAGLVQGILFSGNEGERDVGEEATRVLIKACGGQEARKLLQEEAKGKQVNEKHLNGILDQQTVDGGASSDVVDMNPLFAPYFYSLLNPETLERILPECMTNPHFSVNENADILLEDERKEREEQAAAAPVSTSLVTEEAAAPAALPPVIMPGRKSTSANSKVPAAKSSMFIPSRKPTAVVGGRMGRQMAKPGLHTRKAGAAQKLLGKSRRIGQTGSTATASSGGGTAGASASAAGGRAMKFGNARSKMKMIDVSEVENIAKERQERETKETLEQKMSAKKRKIMEAAAAKGIVNVKGAKRNKLNEAAAGALPTNEQPSFPANMEASTSQTMPCGVGRLEAAAVAALLAYQQHQGSEQGQTSAPSEQAASTAPPAPVAAVDRAPLAPGNKEELDVLLEKSNKLTEENRIRVKQFWIDRFNPTPEIPVVRMKLHEEKIVDPESGETVKNTDYLELDYNIFAYKKLRKSKKK